MKKMTERERLINLVNTNNGYVDEVPAVDFADYLLENGIIVLPCKIKVRDSVYLITNLNEIIEFNIIAIHIGLSGEFMYEAFGYYPLHFTSSDIGKTIFLTREEAENAVRGSESNER